MLEDVASRFDFSDVRLGRLSRLYAVFIVPLLVLILVVSEWLTTDGRHDHVGATFGHDLSQTWVAGRTALASRAAEVYDIALHHHRLIETFGPDAALFVWHYPPTYFCLAAVLATLPYAAAVLAWGLGSLMLIAGTLRRIFGAWRPVVVALSLPPTFECLSYGQNGLLTASLLGLALTFIDRRPVAAGLLLGLISYKPQLAVVVPLIMLATGRWRVAVAAMVCAALGVMVSTVAFGATAWFAFLKSLPETNRVIFEEAWGGLSLNASVFGAIRILGGPIAIAWVAQGLSALAALGFVLKLWFSPCRVPLCPPVRPFRPRPRRCLLHRGRTWRHAREGAFCDLGTFRARARSTQSDEGHAPSLRFHRGSRNVRLDRLWCLDTAALSTIHRGCRCIRVHCAR